MTHQRDVAHALTTSGPAADLDPAHAPGRAGRTDGLIGPHGPRPSGLLMRKASGTVAPDADIAVAAATSSSGEQLPEALRAKFESSLGTDLAGVRVHAGAESAAAASAVGARAYATGNDIHFGAGEYQPASPGGQELIAHEVAHTVQQRGGSPARQHKLEVSSPGDHAEVEADRAASAMVSGAPASVSGASGLGRVVQRKLEGGATGGGKVGKTGATMSMPITLTIPCEGLKYVKGQIDLTATFAATLDWSALMKDAKPGDVDIGGGGAKGNDGEKRVGGEFGLEVSESEIKSAQDEAKKEGEEETHKSWIAGYLPDGDWKVTQGAKVGGEAKGAEVEAQAGYFATLTGKFKNGCTVSGTFKFTPLAIKEGKFDGNSIVGFTVEGTSPAIPFAARTLSNGMKLSGTIQPSAKISLTPKVAEIYKEIAKRVATSGGESAATGVGISAAAALFQGSMFVGIVGGTFAGLVAGAEELAEWDDLVKLQAQGAEAYAGGVLSILGAGSGPQLQPYNALGITHGLQKLVVLVKQAMALPQVKEANLSEDEVMGAIKDAAAKQAGALRPSIVAAASQQIGKELVKAYYAKHKDAKLTSPSSWFFTKNDAQELAHTMGLDNGHDVDLGDKTD